MNEQGIKLKNIALYFLFSLLKVLYSEIALTEKRIIYKRGFIFVKIQEIDIEEIVGRDPAHALFLGAALDIHEQVGADAPVHEIPKIRRGVAPQQITAYGGRSLD